METTQYGLQTESKVSFIFGHIDNVRQYVKEGIVVWQVKAVPCDASIPICVLAALLLIQLG